MSLALAREQGFDRSVAAVPGDADIVGAASSGARRMDSPRPWIAGQS
jgi:hypothetical protein